MNAELEARGRIVIAEFEARKQAERARVRASHWRLAVEIARTVAVAVVGVLLTTHWLSFTGRDWVFYGCLLLVTLQWSTYRLREEMIELRAEVARLKSLVEKSTTAEEE